MCGCAYLTRKFPFPNILRSEQNVALCAANNASVATSFRLFTSGFHFRFFFPDCFTVEEGESGVAWFSDNYFSELNFRILVALHPSPDVLHGTAATVQYCNWHRSQFLPTIMGSQPSTSLRAFPPAQKWHRALRLG